MEHPATTSGNIRNPIFQAARAKPGVWTEGVQTLVGVISCRWVPKKLASGKDSFVCYWKLDGKAINDGALHSKICALLWPEYDKHIANKSATVVKAGPVISDLAAPVGRLLLKGFNK